MASLQEEIAAKANITMDQAKLAYDHVLETIKSKIPASVGDEIHKVMEGNSFDLEAMKSKLADQFNAATSTISEKANETFHNLADQAKNLFGKKD